MLKADLSLRQLMALRGQPVYARSGEEVGRLERLVLDESGGERVWLGLRSGFLRRRTLLVPAGGAALREDGLRVAYGAGLIKAAPEMEAAGIPRNAYTHYRLSSPDLREEAQVAPSRLIAFETQPPAALPARTSASTPKSASSGSGAKGGRQPKDRKAGAVTVAKRVEEHQKQQSLAVEQEVLIVSRTRVDEPVEDVELGAQALTFTLFDHEPSVVTHLVAKERITVEKHQEPTKKPTKETAHDAEAAAEGPAPEVDEKHDHHFAGGKDGNRKTA